jgi:uncharacterized protein (TIGR00106 family)
VSVLVAFSVAPSSADESVSAAVAAAVRVVRESGLPNETNAMFTNVEGEWDEVMDVVKRAVEAVAAVSPRVSLVLKADIREGVTGAITTKVQRVEERLRD